MSAEQGAKAAARPRRITFERVGRGDWIALLAASALLLVMAMDWYSTTTGEEARRIEGLSRPDGALAGEVERTVKEDAQAAAEGAERNAWQADGAIDRVILAGLLASAALAIAATFMRAAGRRFETVLTPSALAAMAAVVTALLVLYRSLQEPGFDVATTVRPGAPLAIAVLGLLALACAWAVQQEEAAR